MKEHVGDSEDAVPYMFLSAIFLNILIYPHPLDIIEYRYYNKNTNIEHR